ncbi:cysteine desulfurase family protein [Stackebrandtia nassauensis]|uniref:Aminotransferase class V n=1 Tax=Stackebrandtia nassauensis (strain DSM 44728 / CIP 108903 / NRRL B-16338 / NBRC 102104 / LLR-40K-21) TaxID=446470 RepID=D3Q130_STANL|nr:aminotransferase class V-fold PLP-dependent enzyme [Stackebrandtia nassauensis]ADD43780.1 aminotransferase class V [Stackebrandtia nassauensis DSM 44728]
MTFTYLDAATASPVHPVAEQAFQAASADGWADPSRLYSRARRARQLLDAARETVAEAIGARPDEVSFTASGTQAVHAGVLGALAAGHRRGDRLVHSAVEHSSVLHAAGWHTDRGGASMQVPVARTGAIKLDALAEAVGQPGVALVAVQSANHEVGTVQPLTEVAELCGDIPLLVDAAQSLGRMPVPAWSLLCGSARKWGGPAGVGVLAVRAGVRWRSPWPEDSHDPDAPGALNLPAVVAAAASLRAVLTEREKEDERLRSLTSLIRAEVARIPYVEVVGDPVERLPHIVTFSYPFEDGQPLLVELDRRGFAVSAGSSCTSSTLSPSHVLENMGVLSHGNIRVSLHRETTADDVDRFLTALPQVVAKVRDESGVSDL